MSKRARLWLTFVLLPWIMLLTGCAWFMGDPEYAPLEPMLCKPADDLPPKKTVSKLPETATPNDVAFALWLRDRSMWAKDVADYNSLYKTCVVGGSGE
jgi:hypothetical protein